MSWQYFTITFSNYFVWGCFVFNATTEQNWRKIQFYINFNNSGVCYPDHQFNIWPRSQATKLMFNIQLPNSSSHYEACPSSHIHIVQTREISKSTFIKNFKKLASKGLILVTHESCTWSSSSIFLSIISLQLEKEVVVSFHSCILCCVMGSLYPLWQLNYIYS